jgi:hypothetical protein
MAAGDSLLYMANDNRGGHEVEGRSLSRERMERSKKSSKRMGRVVLAMVLLVVGGIAWYGTKVYLPEKAEKAYALETERLLNEANSEIARLNEWSSEANVNAFSEKLQSLESRKDVDAAWVKSVKSQFEPVLVSNRERGELFERLMGRISDLNESSGQAEISAFDKELLSAKSRFDLQQFSEIKNAWQRRRTEIGANVKTGFGDITIYSVPSKADVYLDGERIAVTPFSAKGLMSGERQLRLTKAGYRDLSMSIMIEAGGHLELNPLELAAIAGGLRIEVTGGRKKDTVEVEIEEFSETQSAGAFQVVQGFQVLKGRTHTLDTLKAGKYSVVILNNEKVVHRDSVVVKENEVAEFQYEL